MEALTPALDATTMDEDVATHHTEERRQRLVEFAAAPNRYAKSAFRWVEDDPGAIDAYGRALNRLDRYQDVLGFKRLCRGRRQLQERAVRAGGPCPPPSALDPAAGDLEFHHPAGRPSAKRRPVRFAGPSPAGAVRRTQVHGRGLVR